MKISPHRSHCSLLSLLALAAVCGSVSCGGEAASPSNDGNPAQGNSPQGSSVQGPASPSEQASETPTQNSPAQGTEQGTNNPGLPSEQTGGVDLVDAPSDQPVSGLNTELPSRRLALGWSHACAVKTSGEVVCGGWDWTQQSDPQSPCSPAGIEGTFAPPTAQFAYVDGEAYATCGIEKDTQVLKCWGDHYVSDELTDLPGAVQVTVSVSQACALTVADQVVCNGPRVVNELSGLSATEIAMGHDHLCALLADGQIQCQHFGGEERDFGQSNVPAGQYKVLAAGRSTTCGIDMADQLHCWGLDDQGQASSPPGSFTRVDVGPSHGCGIRDTGELACWGANQNGESTPPGGQFSEVAVGYGFSCGLRVTGSVECWGVADCANTDLPSAL